LYKIVQICTLLKCSRRGPQSHKSKTKICRFVWKCLTFISLLKQQQNAGEFVVLGSAFQWFQNAQTDIQDQPLKATTLTIAAYDIACMYDGRAITWVQQQNK